MYLPRANSRSPAVARFAKIDVLKAEQKQAERSLSRTVTFLDKEVGDVVEREPFLDFFKTPYAVIPFGKNKVLVAVPKFVKLPGRLALERD